MAPAPRGDRAPSRPARGCGGETSASPDPSKWLVGASCWSRRWFLFGGVRQPSDRQPFSWSDEARVDSVFGACYVRAVIALRGATHSPSPPWRCGRPASARVPTTGLGSCRLCFSPGAALASAVEHTLTSLSDHPPPLARVFCGDKYSPFPGG